MSNLMSIFVTLIVLISSSAIICISLVKIGQTWARTFSHTATIFILPVTTFVITKAIGSNIALSLGMVGALSIVRFRNPVKSPFELTVYFAVITLGITASVGLKYVVFYLSALIAIFVMFAVGEKIFISFKKVPLFRASFSEGNQMSVLSVRTTREIVDIQNESIITSIRHEDGEYEYIFCSTDFEVLKATKNALVESVEDLDYSLVR